MRYFWIVMKFELILIFKRNWGIWLIALAMVIIGALAADNNRNQPWGSWGQIISCGMFLSLILVLSTGNQVNRDHERRLDGVVFSTPVTTSAYVLGKYGAALLSLLGFASLSLVVAIVTDQFYSVPQRVFFLSPVFYPPLGFQPYVLSWLWLVLVPVIFGATFMFAGITLTHGKRVIAYIATIMAWLIPLFVTASMKSFLLDITATSFISNVDPAGYFAYQHNLFDTMPPPQVAQQILHLSLAELPPSLSPGNLLWNRLFFLGISLILLCMTIFGVQRTRRRA